MDILVGWHIDHTQKQSVTQQVSGHLNFFEIVFRVVAYVQILFFALPSGKDSFFNITLVPRHNLYLLP